MPRHQWTHLVAALLLSGLFLLGSASEVVALQVGDKAPDFALPATTAEQVKLSDFLGKKAVVLFFYTGAFTRI